ncbi:MAG: hypothetical protein R3E01_16525 [Pirellulaceae bacterium]
MQAGDDAIGMKCGVCGTRFYGSSHQIGQRVECPDCGTPALVKAMPEKKKRSPPELIEENPYRLLAEGEALPNFETEFRFGCSVCGTSLSAPRSHVGKQIRCPDCHSSVTVPQPVVAKPKRQPQLDPAFNIPAAPTAPNTVHADIAHQLLADAAKHVDEQAAKLPKGPKRPFRESIIGFGFYGATLALWLAFTCGLSLEHVLISVINDLTDSLSFASIIAIFVSAIASFVAIAMIIIISNYLLAIVIQTSAGYDRMESGPESFGMVEWIWNSFFVVNALAFSCLPGGLIAAPVGGILPIFIWTIPLVSAMFLLPLVLSSMLHENSRIQPYSAGIFATLRTHSSAWFAAYSWLIPLWLFIVGGQWITLLAAPVPVKIAAVGISTFCLLIYARVVGRLIWAIGRPSRQRDVPVENSDHTAELPVRNRPSAKMGKQAADEKLQPSLRL